MNWKMSSGLCGVAGQLANSGGDHSFHVKNSKNMAHVGSMAPGKRGRRKGFCCKFGMRRKAKCRACTFPAGNCAASQTLEQGTPQQLICAAGWLALRADARQTAWVFWRNSSDSQR